MNARWIPPLLLCAAVSFLASAGKAQTDENDPVRILEGSGCRHAGQTWGAPGAPHIGGPLRIGTYVEIGTTSRNGGSSCGGFHACVAFIGPLLPRAAWPTIWLQSGFGPATWWNLCRIAIVPVAILDPPASWPLRVPIPCDPLLIGLELGIQEFTAYSENCGAEPVYVESLTPATAFTIGG